MGLTELANKREKAALSGAQSGRGFRYQDAVAAAFAILAHVEGVPWTIWPEATDDITVTHGQGHVIEVQAKSRRAQEKDVTAADLIRTLARVWERHADRLADEEIHVCLVLDRIPTGCTQTGLDRSLADQAQVDLTKLGTVAASVGQNVHEFAARSHILVVEGPAISGSKLLANHLDVLPIEAEILFRQVLAKIGQLLDERSIGSEARGLSQTTLHSSSRNVNGSSM